MISSVKQVARPAASVQLTQVDTQTRSEHRYSSFPLLIHSTWADTGVSASRWLIQSCRNQRSSRKSVSKKESKNQDAFQHEWEDNCLTLCLSEHSILDAFIIPLEKGPSLCAIAKWNLKSSDWKRGTNCRYSETCWSPFNGSSFFKCSPCLRLSSPKLIVSIFQTAHVKFQLICA